MDRLDIHPLAQTQVRARAPTLQGALGLLYMTRMCGCSKQGGNEKFIRIWCRSGINHILFIVLVNDKGIHELKQMLSKCI